MKIKRSIVLLVLSLLSSLAMAGYTAGPEANPEVELQEDGSGRAQGSMVQARFSDNEIEMIGCGIRTFDDGQGGLYQYGFCQATDAEDERGFCTTENPQLLDTMKSTADYSFLVFSWDALGQCNYVGFSTQSFYIPKHTDKNDKK